jgi:hypothetical protein
LYIVASQRNLVLDPLYGTPPEETWSTPPPLVRSHPEATSCSVDRETEAMSLAHEKGVVTVLYMKSCGIELKSPVKMIGMGVADVFEGSLSVVA